MSGVLGSTQTRASVPLGDLVVERSYSPPRDELRILHADSRILLAPVVLEQIWAGAGGAVLDGDLLRIRAVNGRLVYRVGSYLAEHDAYLAEWPD